MQIKPRLFVIFISLSVWQKIERERKKSPIANKMPAKRQQMCFPLKLAQNKKRRQTFVSCKNKNNILYLLLLSKVFDKIKSEQHQKMRRKRAENSNLIPPGIGDSLTGPCFCTNFIIMKSVYKIR